MKHLFAVVAVFLWVCGAEASRTEAFLAEAETTGRAQCELPETFWTWLESKPAIRTGLLASHDPLHPGAVKNLHYLMAELGAERSDRYAHLLLATAIAQKATNLETGQPWVVAEASKKKTLDPAEVNRLVAALLNYKNEQNVTLVEMVKDQEAVCKAVGIDLPKKKRDPLWKQLGVESGTFPKRINASSVDFLTALIARYETKLPKFTDGGPEWPLFPIDRAPWPLLMPLSETRPLNECQYVWDHFTGKMLYPEGKKKKCRRIKTYGKYTWDYTLPERKYKQSEWHPDTLPRIVEDGGVCGRQSQLARTTYIALGKPALQMGQPGHSALLMFDVAPDGTYFAKMGQSIAPMNKSYPNWPLNDATGLRSYRNGTRSGAEYHYGLTLAMNQGLDSYMDSRILLHLARRCGEEQQGERRKLLEEAVQICPFNIQAWYTMAQDARANLPQVHQIVQNVNRLMGNPGAAVEFDEDRSATTDFNELPNKPSGAKGNRANMTALVVGMSMVENAYPAALKKGDHLQEGFAFLKQELERQKKIKKSPYDAILRGLMNDVEIAIGGVEPIKNRTTEFVMAEIQRTQKKGKLAAGRIAAELDSLLKAIDNTDEKIVWLQGFRDELDRVHGERRLFKYNKGKGKVSVDKTYEYLVKTQTQLIRGKGKKFRGESVAFQKKHADRMAQIAQEYKKPE
jgi:hypothetical protein